MFWASCTCLVCLQKKYWCRCKKSFLEHYPFSYLSSAQSIAEENIWIMEDLSSCDANFESPEAYNVIKRIPRMFAVVCSSMWHVQHLCDWQTQMCLPLRCFVTGGVRQGSVSLGVGEWFIKSCDVNMQKYNFMKLIFGLSLYLGTLHGFRRNISLLRIFNKS